MQNFSILEYINQKFKFDFNNLLGFFGTVENIKNKKQKKKKTEFISFETLFKRKL